MLASAHCKGHIKGYSCLLESLFSGALRHCFITANKKVMLLAVGNCFFFLSFFFLNPPLNSSAARKIFPDTFLDNEAIKQNKHLNELAA